MEAQAQRRRVIYDFFDLEPFNRWETAEPRKNKIKVEFMVNPFSTLTVKRP